MKITPREKDVLRLLMTGETNKGIGNALDLAETTIKAYVSRLMYKIGDQKIRTRLQLALYAQREGYQAWVFRENA